MASIVPPRPGGPASASGVSRPAATRRSLSSPAKPPMVPLAIILISLVAATALIAIASGDQAGGTADLSIPALGAWFVGSIVGLLAYSWFRTENAKRRMSRVYSETVFRLPLIALGASIVGWVIGSYGAFLIAQAVARR
jgi:hypothetical protein